MFTVHTPVLATAIEKMQADAYHDAPWRRAELDAAVIESRMRAVTRRYGGHGLDIGATFERVMAGNDLCAPALSPPTPLQDPIAYAGLRELWLRASELAARRNKPPIETPMLATLPTGAINARAVRAPGQGQTAIIFDDEIRVLAYLISKIVASALASGGSLDQGFVDLDLNRAADPRTGADAPGVWFAALVDQYLRSGWIRTLPPWTLAPHQHRLALILCAGFEHFVIGHEIGHLACRHLEGAVASGFEFHAEIHELKKRRLQEIEADAFGLMIACDDAHLDLGSPLPGFWGAYLALKSFELIDRCVYAAAKRADWKPYLDDYIAWADEVFEHPPSPLRPMMLLNLIKSPDLQREALQFAAAANVLFDTLFETALPALLQGFDRGVSTRFGSQVSHYALHAPGPDFAGQLR